MGFEINNISQTKRKELTKRDKALIKQCESCSEKTQGFCEGFRYESDHRYCDYDCSTCAAYCCESKEGWYLLNSVGGSDYSSISWNKFDISPLDYPFWRQVNNKIEYADIPVVVVNLNEILSLSGKFSREKDIRKRYEISDKSKVVLSFFTQDPLLDCMCDVIGLEESITELSAYNFDYVIAVNFSLVDNWPVLMNRVNIKRAMLSLKLFQLCGVCVIPDTPFLTEIDRKRYIEWCNQNEVTIVTANMQSYKYKTNTVAWIEKLELFADFLEKVPGIQKVVMPGIMSRSRMEQCLSWFGDKLIILDTKSFRVAGYGKYWDDNRSVMRPIHTFLESVDLSEKYRVDQLGNKCQIRLDLGKYAI